MDDEPQKQMWFVPAPSGPHPKWSRQFAPVLIIQTIYGFPPNQDRPGNQMNSVIHDTADLQNLQSRQFSHPFSDSTVFTDIKPTFILRILNSMLCSAV